MPTLTRINLLNFIWFQAIWILTIVFQYQFLWLALVLFIIHFFVSSQPRLDGITAASVACIGVIVDGGLAWIEVFIFPESYISLPVPLWLVVLWGAFALALRYSLHYLHSSVPLCVIFGAVFGPLSYYAGARLGAVQFGPSVWQSLLVLAAIWGILLPGLVYWNKQLERGLRKAG